MHFLNKCEKSSESRLNVQMHACRVHHDINSITNISKRKRDANFEFGLRRNRYRNMIGQPSPLTKSVCDQVRIRPLTGNGVYRDERRNSVSLPTRSYRNFTE